MKLRKGDNIIVIAGTDQGKKGTITKVIAKNNRIVVEGINKHKKNMRPNKKHPHGGIIEIFTPFNASNAMLICSNCQKPTRVSYKITAENKIRICKKCNQATDIKTKK